MRSSKVQVLVKALVLLMLFSSVLLPQTGSQTCSLRLKSMLFRQMDKDSNITYNNSPGASFGYYPLNGLSSESKYRSVYEVDLPSALPVGAYITKIEFIYNSSAYNPGESFSLYNIPISSYDDTWTNSQIWNVTDMGTYEGNWGVSNQEITVRASLLEWIANNALDERKTKLYLGFRAYPEWGATTVNTNGFQYAKLRYTYEIVVRDTIKNVSGNGKIDVSVNNQPFYEANSGEVLILSKGSVVQLRAKEEQFDGSYFWVWNQDPSTLGNTISNWKIKKEKFFEFFPGRIYTDTAKANNLFSSFTAGIRKKFIINRTDKTEFDGNFQTNDVTRVVEKNSLNIPYSATLVKPAGTYSFVGWEDGGGSVRTPTDNTTYTAIYKIPNKSNTSAAFTNSSQRKLARTPNGSLHLVYESMGKVWYEKSTDNGTTWRIMNGGKPLVSEDAKLPSIEAYDTDSRIIFTYQKRLENGFPPDLYLIELMVYNVDVDSPQDILPVWQSYPYSYNANPVVAFDFNQYLYNRIAVVFQDNSESLPGIFYRLAGLDGTGMHYEWKGSAARLSGTGMYSVNPSIKSPYYSATISKYNADLKFHIAFEQLSTGSSVKYSLLNINPSGAVSVSTPLDISSYIFPAYSDLNEKPLVTVVNGTPYISWLHYSDLTYLHEAALARSTGGSWNLFDRYGKEDDITSVHMNNVGVNNFVLAWNVDGYGNEFVKSTSMATPYITNTSGRDIQVANGTDFTNTRLMSFTNDAVPYYFTISDPMSNGTLAKGTLSKETLSKEKEGQNTSRTVESRTGIIKINEASFRATLGEIKAGESYVTFKDIENDFTPEKENFSQALESREFTASDKTVLSYSSEFTINDSAMAASLFQQGLESLTFSLELVEAKSNEVLKRLTSRTFNSKSLSTGKPQAFRLDLNGIGSRTLKLRVSYDIKANDSLNVEYRLMNYYKPDGKMKKEGYVDLTYSEVKPVTEYALSQNYPNPFNPTTVINYQIPKASKVLLKIYDLLGKEVKTLVNEYKEMGRYSVELNASNLPSGTYIYELRANDFVKSGKMILLK
ncbi:MAG: T9SS type A sorting domain-containing protein [Ignavibacteria bacterium]|jgi:hypothetical protein|nr:T9SS type A sorting domain-containing protein [Ignavibacteria bacterium]